MYKFFVDMHYEIIYIQQEMQQWTYLLSLILPRPSRGHYPPLPNLTTKLSH